MLSELRGVVESKVKNYKPEDDQQKTFDTTDSVPIGKLILRDIGGSEYLLLCFGVFSAMAFGCAVPSFCLLFGGMIDGVGEQDGLS